MAATAVVRFLNVKKGSLAAPLFFLSLALASLGSSFGIVSIWASAILAIAAAGACGRSVATGFTLLTLCAGGFAIAVAASTLLGAAYSPAGLFHPLLLLAGYLVLRTADEQVQRSAVWAGTVFVAGLALWGGVEVALGMRARAQALFETPATFAAVLNLALLPLLTALLARRQSWLLTGFALLFSAGLFLAASRGGELALAGGMGIAILLCLRAGIFNARRLAMVLALVAAGWVAATSLRALPMQPAASLPTAQVRAAASLSRLELYALSHAAWRNAPLTGTGYLTFRYVLEQGRAQVPSYGAENETWFVHNDYVQTLQELGPAGLLFLLGITLLPLVLTYRRLPSMDAAKRTAALALAAALAGMSTHALVDFPFYVPVCLLLYGALLGALDRRLVTAEPVPQRAWKPAPWLSAARAGVLVIGAIALLRPLAAEAASGWGLRKLSQADGRGAAYWLGAAQRIDPRDWRYHWYAGQFWEGQAMEAGKREAAQLAARAYAAGVAANALEVRNLLGLIAVHRRLAALLDAPADESTLKHWSAQARALAPLNPQVIRVVSE